VGAAFPTRRLGMVRARDAAWRVHEYAHGAGQLLEELGCSAEAQGSKLFTRTQNRRLDDQSGGHTGPLLLPPVAALPCSPQPLSPSEERGGVSAPKLWMLSALTLRAEGSAGWDHEVSE
jgi:hypothetical protein